jgi:hypothetical protein
MIQLLLLTPPGETANPAWILVLLFPLFFLGGSLLSARIMGVFDLYRSFPADKADAIETNLGWIQVEFGLWRGHAPMSVKVGRRYLHIKQPFPFQPLFWLGPASIPWNQIQVTKTADTRWWAFWAATEFSLGAFERPIRIRGKAGRKVQDQVNEHRSLAVRQGTTSIQPH